MYPNSFYRVSVKAFIKDRSGRVLVLKENQDTWSLPGGGLNHGEEASDAIKRELNEELGIQDAGISKINQVRTFELKTKQAWLLWLVYDVDINETVFRLGEGVFEACYIDPAILKSSEDIFEQSVYRVATSS